VLPSGILWSLPPGIDSCFCVPEDGHLLSKGVSLRCFDEHHHNCRILSRGDLYIFDCQVSQWVYNMRVDGAMISPERKKLKKVQAACHPQHNTVWFLCWLSQDQMNLCKDPWSDRHLRPLINWASLHLVVLNPPWQILQGGHWWQMGFQTRPWSDQTWWWTLIVWCFRLLSAKYTPNRQRTSSETGCGLHTAVLQNFKYCLWPHECWVARVRAWRSYCWTSWSNLLTSSWVVTQSGTWEEPRSRELGVGGPEHSKQGKLGDYPREMASALMFETPGTCFATKEKWKRAPINK